MTDHAQPLDYAQMLGFEFLARQSSGRNVDDTAGTSADELGRAFSRIGEATVTASDHPRTSVARLLERAFNRIGGEAV